MNHLPEKKRVINDDDDDSDPSICFFNETMSDCKH